MQESYGTSPSGNLKEAVRGISNPAFLILMSNAEQFETHVAELEELYPGVPSIGCIGMSYQTQHKTEKGSEKRTETHGRRCSSRDGWSRCVCIGVHRMGK